MTLCAFRVRLERRAPDDRQHDRREPIVLLRRAARNGADERHVLIFEPAAERVGHQLLDADTRELAGVAVRDPLSKLDGTAGHRIVEQLRGGIDWRSLVMAAPQ